MYKRTTKKGKLEVKLDKNGVWRTYRDGKLLPVGTRPKELAIATGRNLGNAFRDILKIGRWGKNPQLDYRGYPINLLDMKRRNLLAAEKMEEAQDSLDPYTTSDKQYYGKQELIRGVPKKEFRDGQSNPLTIRDGEIDYNTKGETAPQGVPGQAKYGWSDVFTINPETGEALGVMGRKQRKAFEKKYWNDKRIDKSKKRTYNPNKSRGGKAYTRYG
jgi:hypothetical protein